MILIFRLNEGITALIVATYLYHQRFFIISSAFSIASSCSSSCASAAWSSKLAPAAFACSEFLAIWIALAEQNLWAIASAASSDTPSTRQISHVGGKYPSQCRHFWAIVSKYH